MGHPRTRQPRPVEMLMLEGFPGRPLVIIIPQARDLPQGLPQLRSRGRRKLQRKGYSSSARRPRHHPLPGQDRSHHQWRAHLQHHAGRRRGLLHLRMEKWLATSRDPEQSPLHGRHPSQDRTHKGDISAELRKSCGFKFVGPVIVYAWMQATGIVNDHFITCPRHAAAMKKK